MSTQTPPSSPPPGTAHSGDEFFDRIRALGVVRPDDGRWAAGVCAAVARRLGVDPLLVRGIAVALTIVGGAGLFLYGLAWMFLPQPDGRIHAQEVLRGVVSYGFVGAALAILSASGGGARLGGNGWGFFPFTGGLATLAVVALGVWWLANRGRHRGAPDPSWYGPGQSSAPSTPSTPSAPSWGSAPAEPSGRRQPPRQDQPPGHDQWVGPGQSWAPTPPPPDLQAPVRALTRTTLGVAVLLAAGLGLWSRYAQEIPFAPIVAGAAALAVLAIGIVVAGLSGRRAGGLAPIAILLAIVVVNTATLRDANTGIGRRVWAPVAASQGTSWDLGVGDARLDLTAPELTAGASTSRPLDLRAHLGVGRLLVVVPAGTSVRVHATVGIGNVRDGVGGTGDAGGAGRDVTVRSGSGDPVIELSADVGIGSIEVVPQGSAAATARSAADGPRTITETVEARR